MAVRARVTPSVPSSGMAIALLEPTTIGLREP